MNLGDRWAVLEVVESTQTSISELGCDICFAHDQTQGKGRLGRKWLSEPNHSLTFSLAFREYADHSKPWLIGMAVSLAVAQVIDCSLQWPNDLVFERKKVGGVLTELITIDSNPVPELGIGINLGQKSFPPEFLPFATSLWIEKGVNLEPLEGAKQIVEQIRSIPCPQDWADLWPEWRSRDQTPGKRFRTPDGIDVEAIGIGPEGELLAYGNDQQMSILAAEAIFGA